SFWGGKFAELVSYIRSLTQDSKHRGHCTWLCKCGDKWDSIYEPEAFKCTAIGYVENGIVNTNKNVKTNGHVEKCGNIKTKCNVTLLLSVRMERIVGAISVHVQKLGNDLNMQRNVKINGQIKTTGFANIRKNVKMNKINRKFSDARDSSPIISSENFDNQNRHQFGYNSHNADIFDINPVYEEAFYSLIVLERYPSISTFPRCFAIIAFPIAEHSVKIVPY
ncbi:14605_t:CDS:2, partial [Entrophospora sp. SA101]